MRGIAKQYGSVAALRGIDFTLDRGEVMALLGENGAGKSTLVKVLSGLERLDSSTIKIGGQPVRLRSPAASLHAGVAYVTQELSIVGALSVAENICMGGGDDRVLWTARPQGAALSRPGRARRHRSRDARWFPLGRAAAACRNRPPAFAHARILVLDEPTAALSDAEIEKVKTVVRTLAAEGRSIIYVTHRFGEVC